MWSINRLKLNHHNLKAPLVVPFFMLHGTRGIIMLSPLDMFAIGVGPSSSHTVGPMKAGLEFANKLEKNDLLLQVKGLKSHLYGSLALTGEGHGTFLAVLNGLSGQHPKTIDPDTIYSRVEDIKNSNELNLNGKHKVAFNYSTDLLIHKDQFLPEHANGMRFTALDLDGNILLEEEYFSIGGGFILDKEQIMNRKENEASTDQEISVPYPFHNAEELFGHCHKNNLSVAEVVLANELVFKTRIEVYKEALEIAEVMRYSVNRGILHDGILPGGLNVKRRAPQLYSKLIKNDLNLVSDQDRRLLAMTYAIAVNEENAAFSRVVTAPTNGSAGTIPGVLEYYRNFYLGVTDDKIVEFILTAGAIGNLYKYGASISAAEVGCQGEIGVACSMAAGAMTAVLGGSYLQVEKAAEIAMEHCLGMTCDPINGLVQIPCIERNGVAASKAIDIAKLSLLENEPGKVSLDAVIHTMMQNGRDMSTRYKETALAGLAVNVVEC
jgi:L-serine dehydratase